MYLGGQHVSPEYCQMRAPLNPILGETLQRVCPDGARIYLEQTSHHPPITHFSLESADYRFSGYFEYKAWLAGLNTIGGTRVGKLVLSFNDGGVFSFKDPHVEIAGLTYGDRTHQIMNQIVITDHINKLESVVTFNVKPTPTSNTSATNSGGTSLMQSLKKKLLSATNQGSSQNLSDQVSIQIHQKALNNNNNKQKVVVCEGHGSWLEYIAFNNHNHRQAQSAIYWHIGMRKPDLLFPSTTDDTYLLPSDTSQRADA